VIFIDTQAEFDAAMARVAAQPVVSLDTEADSLHSYFDKVCLIQMSIPGEDLIIDPLSKIDLASFGEVLANRAITKILHGADYDLRILNRDFGYTIANLIDTMVCSQLLGYEAFGLAALLAASALAFTMIKWLGAAYLLWLAFGMLRAALRGTPDTIPAPSSAPAGWRKIYMQGFVTNVLNPKVALFFLALLPQFIAADAPSKPLAFLFLGALFVVNGTLFLTTTNSDFDTLLAVYTGDSLTNLSLVASNDAAGRPGTNAFVPRLWPAG